jgi:uncharacterized protein (TIGR03437 family)
MRTSRRWAAPVAVWGSRGQPGETILLYGTGFGATDPAVAAGFATAEVAPMANPVKVSIGGVSGQVSFAGLVPPFARLYQFNVIVPNAVPDGDQAVVAGIGGFASPKSDACCVMAVQR